MNNTCIILLVTLLLVWLIYRTGKDSMSNFNFELDSAGKMRIYDDCKFDGIGIIGLDWEIGECSIAIQIIPLVNNVLEIGGGAGKVSHMINKILQKRGLGSKHVVVEPGPNIRNAGSGHMGNNSLYKNKQNFGDQYHIVEKLAENLSEEDITIINPPDCLFVDCEGCLGTFFKTTIGKYVLSNVRFVVNEMDGENEYIRNTLSLNGFRKVGIGYGCDYKCETEVWYRG